VVSGIGRVTLDGDTKDYKAGEVVIIRLGIKHRIENPLMSL